jgi:polyhydroxybutyrate depolymerase
MHRRFAAAIGALLSSACSAARPLTLAHDGVEREYLLHVPASPSAHPPLIIALHGGGGTAKTLDHFTNKGLTREAAARGWVLAIPQGVEKGWNDGRAPVTEKDRRRSTVDDVGFLTRLIATLEETHDIDPNRVMMVGVSNGGHMAYRLGIEAADHFTAIAPVIAGHPAIWTTGQPGLWTEAGPARPVSVLVMNGTKDPLIPYKGGQVTVFDQERGEVLSAADTIAWWSARDRCPSPPSTRTLPDRDPEDGTRVTVKRRDGCADGTEVTLVRVDGGGHTWPGGNQYLPESLVGTVSHDVDGSKILFRFFDRHVDDRAR